MSIRFRAIQRTWKSFKRQPLMHLASISTISVSCLILGTFLLCYRNFETLAENSNPHMTGTAYLKDQLSENQIEELRERLLSLENVRKVTFKPKNKVADELQVFLGASGTEVLPGSELFPDLMELQLNKNTSAKDLSYLKSAITRESLITEVDFSEDWLAQYKKVRGILGTVGWILGGALVIGCGFIIANFMGIRHQSRKEEMEIVQLIGAERTFILTPFIWEGIFEGILGAGTSLALLLFLKWFFAGIVGSEWNAVLGISSWMFLTLGQISLICFIGITMALLGSFAVFFRTVEQVR